MNFLGAKDGLSISANWRSSVGKVADVVAMGDTVKVKVLALTTR